MKDKVTKLYYAGMSYYSLPYPMTLTEAKKWTRKFFEVKRLPNNTCFCA